MKETHLVAKYALPESLELTKEVFHTFQSTELILNANFLFFYLYLPYYFLPMIHPITSSLEVFERVDSAKLVPWNKAITRSQTVKISSIL
jgi:hypothetical protein